MSKPRIGAVVPWFGSNRMLAPRVGEVLGDCEWVGIPFAGSMAEVPHIKARTLVVNDLHRFVMNLAEISAHPKLGPELYRRLRRRIFHPDELSYAQLLCKEADFVHSDCLLTGLSDSKRLELAEAYFVAMWMNRSAKAGTKNEFKGQLPIRWEAGGGDSSLRFHNAVRSLTAWRRTLQLRRCNFSTLHFRDFLAKCKDRPRHGIYCDPPFLGPGDAYRHTMTREEHDELAGLLTQYQQATVVCRFYANAEVKDLYSDPSWVWHELEGRKQSNAAAPELLIVRNGE